MTLRIAQTTSTLQFLSAYSLNASHTRKDSHYSHGYCFAEASPVCLILLVPLMLGHQALEVQPPPCAGQTGAMHPVSHLASHSAAPHSEEAVAAVHRTLQLYCLAVIVLEAMESSQQHARRPAAHHSMVTAVQEHCNSSFVLSSKPFLLE